MPNHITNWIEIKGTREQMAKLRKDCIKMPTKDKEMQFDFNGIIPMPPELKETASPTEVVNTQEEADKINKEYQKNWGKSEDNIKAITRDEAVRRTELYGPSLSSEFQAKLAKARNKEIEIWGCLNWYDWAVQFWGTKWGAYDVIEIYTNPTTLVLEFRTAWSPPEPIYRKLEEMGFEVNGYWEDEDPDNNGYIGDGVWDKFNIDRSARVEYLGGE